jgi:hypothetical protein
LQAILLRRYNLKSYNNNHFTPSDENKSSRKVTHVIDDIKESLHINSSNNNKFTPSDEKMSSRKKTNSVIQPQIPVKHPIVNLCMPYIESVFFQLDSAPGTSGTIQFNNHQQGRIVDFTYFLDSSMNDNVLVNVDKISGNNGRKSLIKFVQGGNTFIKGTNNSTLLKFNVNLQILKGEKIQITYNNTSSQDCTIMAIANIKYGEEDFISD